MFDIRLYTSLIVSIGVALFTLIYPDELPVEKFGIMFLLGSYIIIQFIAFIYFTKKGKIREKHSFAILSIFFMIIFLIWEGLTTKWNVPDSFIFPNPEKVLDSITNDRAELLQHILSSTKLLITGYGLAVFIAVTLGILAGSNKYVLEFIRPIASVASPIPPIVYIPYAITLLPTFFMSSVFVVFIGAFLAYPIECNEWSHPN